MASSMGRTLTKAFGSSLSEVPAARHFVQDAAADWGVADEAMAAIITELAANSIRHSSRGFSVRLSFEAGVVMIEVGDSSPHCPEVQAVAIDSARGRGLRIVGSLTSDWGVRSLGSRGKVIWAEVGPLPPNRSSLLTGDTLPPTRALSPRL
jgi:two-component sensor histidine kinase